MAKAQHPVPEGFRTVTAQLTMENAAAAIDWYKRALGAEEVARALGPDGKIIHAEIRVGDTIVMLNDDIMGSGNTVKGRGGSPVSMWCYVADCDALFNRAVKAGAEIAKGGMGAMQDQFWGDRSGSIVDPEGYMWTIATHKEDLTPAEMQQRQDEWMRQFASANA